MIDEANNKFKSSLLSLRNIVVGIIVLYSPFSFSTDIEIKPTIESKLLSIADVEKSDPTTNEDERTANVTNVKAGDSALTLTPGLSLIATGPLWNANWTFSNTTILRDGDYKGRSSINNLSINNQFTFLRERLTFFANANRRNQNIDSRRAGFSDPVFNQGEYIDVDTFNVGMNARTIVNGDWQNQFSYQASKTDFDEKELAETDATSTNLYNNDSQSVSFTSQYGRRAEQIRGELSLRAQTSDRAQSGDQNSSSIAVNLGIPIWSSLDFVINGNKTMYDIETQNDDVVLPDFDSESYGLGLAWRFSNRSYIEVTRNKDTRGQTIFAEEKVNAEFTGVKLVLKPNDRASVEFDHSQRFYGESNSASIDYSANRWSFRLNYRESLDTNNRIVRDVFSIGPHLCPERDSDAESCEALEEIPTERPDEGFLLELFDVDYSIREELVLNKGGSATFQYRNKKSTLSLAYNKNQRQFLEREGNLDSNAEKSESVSLSYQYQMSRRTSFKMDIAESTIDRRDRSASFSNESDANGSEANDNEKLQQKSFRASIGLDRKLTRKATGTLSISHNESEGQRFTYRPDDTRIELTYKYTF